jgi:SAM-dependent methyltransferase
MDAEAAQREHYNRIAADYEAHYDDHWSREYRDRFIYAPMLDGVDLTGKPVLEAMCGSGSSIPMLLARGAQVTGLDISEATMRSFRQRWPQCQVACGPIARSGLPSESFEAVIVVGGLHHLQPDVDPAVDEIHRLLRPRGYFCFIEPHTGSLPDFFRQLWYKQDPLFASNEAAIDLAALHNAHGHQFEFVREVYGGNVAFLLVYNSMIFRVPLGLKRFYSPLMLSLEALITRFQGKRSACYVVCRWRKR